MIIASFWTGKWSHTAGEYKMSVLKTNDFIKILDSRPTNDIALLIISSLPSKVRRENTGKLLNLYYTSLKNNLDKISVDLEVDLSYSRHKLEQDYK